MCAFVSAYGESVRQMTVRSLTTQNKPGTLPISAYAQSPPNIDKLDLSQILPLAESAEDEAVELVVKDSVFVVPPTVMHTLCPGVSSIRASSFILVMTCKVPSASDAGKGQSRCFLLKSLPTALTTADALLTFQSELDCCPI